MNDIPLSPIDYVFTGAGSIPITFAFFYPHPLDQTLLWKGLSETIQFFPLVESRLAKTGEKDYSFRVSEGDLAIETRVSDQSFAESRAIGRYVSPVDSSEGHLLSRASLTTTPDGSVFAISISHALVDGFSYFHFLSSWARACRGERILPPVLGREGVPSDLGNLGKPVTSRTLLEHCGLFLADRRNPQPGGTDREERIFLSKDRLREMLEEAKHDQPDALFSENDVVTAWLWKKFLPHWVQGSDDLDVYVTCPVDSRRIYKILSRHYFGCGLCFASVSTRLGHLQQASLGELALRVNGAVHKVNNDFASRSMRTLAQFRGQQGLAAMEHIHAKHPAHGLIVTNLTRMPIQDLDFGAGAPADILFHSDVSGSAALLPGENGIGIAVLHPPILV
ncbi:MAG: hypothetical protein JSV89_19480 [Spirochaetaceae bacterium]|nr:MAG: hypothetical protein JSV89_19480 [Spirochaetaceae bacterium]